MLKDLPLRHGTRGMVIPSGTHVPPGALSTGTLKLQPKVIVKHVSDAGFAPANHHPTTRDDAAVASRLFALATHLLGDQLVGDERGGAATIRITSEKKE